MFTSLECEPWNMRNPVRAVQSRTSNKKFRTGWWDTQEHAKFLQGLQRYGRNWKKVSEFVATRSQVQTRTHAQKYFLKLKKFQEDQRKKRTNFDETPTVGQKHSRAEDEEQHKLYVKKCKVEPAQQTINDGLLTPKKTEIVNNAFPSMSAFGEDFPKKIEKDFKMQRSIDYFLSAQMIPVHQQNLSKLATPFNNKSQTQPKDDLYISPFEEDFIDCSSLFDDESIAALFSI